MIESQHPIVKWFDETLILGGYQDKEVTGIAGIARSITYSWRRGAHPRLGQLDAALEAMGYKLAIVDADTGEVVGP